MPKRKRSNRKNRTLPQQKAIEPQILTKAQVPREQITHYANRISLFLRKENGRPLRQRELREKCRGRGQAAYLLALNELLAQGLVADQGRGYVWAESAGMFRAKIVSLHRTYAYAQSEQDGKRIFLAGRSLKGAMVGDTVLLSPSGERKDTPEATVVTILVKADAQVAGTLILEEDALRFLPDTLCKQSLKICNASDWMEHIGEKALARVSERGTQHSEHIMEVLFVLGSADSAEACAKAIVAESGVPTAFSEAACAEAEKIFSAGIDEEEIQNRLDLRHSSIPIFTIDGHDAKDLDDAVSIEQTEEGFRLGVHIADVSHYVKLGSCLDEEAIARGTSIYYANQVLPMLPKALSNGICSLNPGEDRLTFSVLMDLDQNGEIQKYRFVKSVICSRIKGEYAEVNAILQGRADAETEEKYRDVRDALFLLNALREIRLTQRKKRGAPFIEAEESTFFINESGICTEVIPRTRGAGEEMIEECMLLANEAAAKLARAHGLPFVYRVHAAPPVDKTIRLAEMLDRLDIPHPSLVHPQPADYAKILENVADSPLKASVHQMVLRSMAKASYETEPIGHFGLALADYTHFTSPIRRYPDLAIHRILTAFCAGSALENGKEFAQLAAQAGTDTEQRAVQLERDCEERYCAEWARQHIGECFQGVISGVTEFGLYVMLMNTAEGLISVDTLPADDYEYDGDFTLMGVRTARRFLLGDAVQVICVHADVNSGHIDFVLDE